MSRNQAHSLQPPPQDATLAQLLQASHNIAWIASPDLKQLIDISQAGCQLYGREKSELLGNRDAWLENIHANDRAQFDGLIDSLQPRPNAQLQYRVIQPQGEVRWLRDNITLLSLDHANPLDANPASQLICGMAVDVTDIMEERSALQDSKDVLSGLIQQLPMNVLRKDLRGRIVFANQQFCDSRNIRFQDVVGKTDFDLYPAELAKKYRDDDRKVLDSGEMIEVFEKHHSPMGKTVYVQVRKGPVWDAQGNQVGIQIMFWDATDRKQAEAQLEHERNLLHALLDNGPDSIYFKDTESRFIRVSRGLAEKFHLSGPGVAIGKSDADFFSPEHAQRAREDELEIMRGGDPILGKEERETWSEGEDTWCSSTKMALRDPEGNVIGTFGISRDITDKKRAKAELGRERDLLKTIIDNLPDQVFAKDRAGRFILANQALLAILGVTSVEEVIGKTDYDFSQPELACEYVADDQIVMRSGESLIDQEEYSFGLDGQEVCNLMSKVPLRDSSGKIRGLVGIGRDITRRKQESEALREAMELADKANEAKSNFLANMSHEIRTPLNAIIGMTDLVLNTELTDSQREFLSMVQESGSNLLRVINDILDFSKIEAGKLELDPISFDLRDQLGGTMRSMAIHAHDKSLELALRVQPDVPEAFFGDIGRLRQIIVNLVANAIKFTESGEVVVEVRLVGTLDRTAQLQFSVRDTGIGISEAQRETIFAEFEQADSSTTRQYGGTGLGLAISTRLVELMEGRIWVESQLGKGSTFHFAISLELVDKNGLPRTEDVVVGGTSVLIVDDNTTNRLILEEMVRSWGMIATQADGVRSAQAIIDQAAQRGHSFQLVLSDVNMPDEDGFDLAKWIRQHDALTDCEIIMLSSSDRIGDHALREASQVAASLRKPVKQSELFDTIVRVLGHRNGNHKNGSRRQMSSKPDTPARPLRILLAEDSVFNQKLAVALLEQRGHQVSVVENGQQAIDAVQRQEFDLVLMDVQMPVMDGLESTRMIRNWEREERRKRLPILAMTAHALQGDRSECISAGMDEYIAKPIDAEALFTMIESVFETSGEEIVLEFDDNIDAQRSESDAAIVDFDVGLQRVRGSHDTLRTLALILLEECPKLVAQIASAIEEQDAKSLQRSAHTLKGSSSHFAAKHVVHLAEAIEVFGSNGEYENANKLMAKLRQEVGRLEEAIRAWLE